MEWGAYSLQRGSDCPATNKRQIKEVETSSQLNKQLLFVFWLPFSECLVSARHHALHTFIIFLSNSSIIQYHLFQ